MTLEELKQCNKDNKKVLPNGVNGDFVLHVGDVLNVKGKVISTRVVDGNKQPKEDLLEKKTWDKVSNKRILKLNPKIQTHVINFINDVEKELGIKLRITQGLRTIDEQNALYAIGRTVEGEKVTNAKGGESYHNYGLAIDIAEVKNAKVTWDSDFDSIAKIGIKHGFEWGGNFKSIIDKPHFQMTFDLSIKDLKNGSNP
jgi:LAS superfamily LD-carboxypeptidase LdcB